MELKQSGTIPFPDCWCSINRTLVELKQTLFRSLMMLIRSINRTLVELKPDNALTRWLGRVPINRTLVELKLEV